MEEVIYSRINSDRTVVPRTLCHGCWENITICIRLRTNLNLNPQHVITVLSEYLSSNRDAEGNSVAVRESCLSQQPTDQDIILHALFCFLDSFPLGVLLTVLESRGLSQLGDAFCVRHSFGLVIAVPDGQLYESRRLQRFYYTLKNFIDNNVINVESQFLTEFFDRKIRRLENMDETDLELNTNKLALITWLRIQQCKRDTRQIRKVLNICSNNCPNNVDKTLVKAIYYSKMAVADAMDGDKISARLNVHKANYFILPVNDPIKVLLYHDRRYVYQLIGQRDCELSSATDRALAILSSCDAEANHCEYLIQMKRMFLLYSAQYHLGIGNDLNVTTRVVPDADHATAAKGHLHCFEESKSNGVEVEPRRLMIFYFCKGIYLERRDSETAVKCLERALSFAQSGATFGRERQNIETVLAQMRDKNNLNN